MNLLRKVIAACCIALIASCGGGGGSTPTPTPAPAPAPAPSNAPPNPVLTFTSNVSAQNNGQLFATQGTAISISAASSTDPDGDALTFQWEFAAKPSGSTASLAPSPGPSTGFVPDVLGEYTVLVRATDGRGGAAERRATINVNNQPPQPAIVVNVDFTGPSVTKPDQSIAVGAAVVLNASGSSDPQGDSVSVAWSLVEAPTGSIATLDTTMPMVARFAADRIGTFKVRARLTDAKGAWSDTIHVFLADNHAPNPVVATTVSPIAGASSALTTSVGYDVVFNGGGSQDPDGDSFTYAWTLMSKPATSAATLSSASASSSKLVPDKLGTYVVRLRATDSKGALADHTVTVTVNNHRPTITVGSNGAPSAVVSATPIRVPLNTEVTLRGSDSTDADGDALTYTWTLVSKPSGSAAVLSSASTANVKITVDLRGSYTVRLRVTDSKGAFAEKLLTLEAGNTPPRPVIDRDRTMVIVNSPLTVSGALSFDDEGDSLTYQWQIDSKPATSTAALGTPTAAATTLTPDKAGMYVLALTVNDGKQTATAYTTVYARATSLGAVALGFTPLDMKYSKGLELVVMTQSSPPALRTLDPVAATVKTVLLPLPAKDLALSPNGRRAVVAHDGAITLVDLQSTSIVRTISTALDPTAIFVGNNDIAYLFGGSTFPSYVHVADLTTGTVTATPVAGHFFSFMRGVHAGLLNRIFVVSGNVSPSDISYISLDPASGAVVGGSDSPYHGDYLMHFPLFLSATQDRVITTYGTMFRTSDLTFAGTILPLDYARYIVSLSAQTGSGEETLGVIDDGLPRTTYKRWTGAFFTPQPDLPVPQISGQTAHIQRVFHSGSGNHVLHVIASGADYIVFR